ncbi:hypothetical protein GCM10028807_40760 [Spirosoma daeguense]
MSLLHKTLLYLLLASIPVVVGGGWLFHLLIDRGIQYEIDEQLSSDLAFIHQQLKQGHSLNGQFPLDNPQIEPISATTPVSPVFSNTQEFDWRENQQIPVRKLVATILVNNKAYRITVRHAMGELNEIARLLSLIVTVGLVLLLGLLVLLNGWVSRKLWQPFYQLIEELGRYRLDDPVPTTFTPSTIREFNQLSNVLNSMSSNVYHQYKAQKEFADNAAHEMQTPLALLTTQIDNLLATEPLTGEQVELMELSQHAIRRLANLNKGLLLLTKLDNQQFSERETVNLSDMVQHQFRQFMPYADYRNINWHSQISPAIYRNLSPYLVDILLVNLLKNTLMHADKSTNAEVILTETNLITRNVAPALPFPADQLFQRFVKNPGKPESTGLGLALVKQIAEQHGSTATYTYDAITRTHEFRWFLPPV